MTEIDRVARAIAKASDYDLNAWTCEEYARAAIAAMDPERIEDDFAIEAHEAEGLAMNPERLREPETNVVKRLRKKRQWLIDAGATAYAELLSDAIAEIASLRKQVAAKDTAIRKLVERLHFLGDEHLELLMEANAALKEGPNHVES